jgi:hypothetical protein
MVGKEKVPERRSGLRPSEKELPERRSGEFRHKNTPGFMSPKRMHNWRNKQTNDGVYFIN